MNAEKLKKLKDSCVNHEDLVVDFGNGLKEELYYDEKIKNYRGKQIGIWSIKLLAEIARGEVENISLEVSYE